jgi:hypothetical protein
MGIVEKLAEMGFDVDGPADFGQPLAVLQAYIDAPKLENLKHGDVVVQVKRGQNRKGKNHGNPVIFDRYLTENEKVHVNFHEGNKVEDHDAVLIMVVDTTDGEVIRFAVDSSDYRMYDPAADDPALAGKSAANT